LPINPAITQAPQPSKLFSDTPLAAAPELGGGLGQALAPPLAQAPELAHTGAPVQPAAPAPEQSFGDSFATGVGDELSAYGNIIAHPIDALGGAAQGIGALLSGEGDAAGALREMLSSVRNNPGEALGHFVAGLPLMLLPGGAAARLTGGAAKAATLARGASKLTSSAVGAATGAATGAAASTAFAGALTNARGEELTPSDARLAAVLGSVAGTVARRGDVHDVANPAIQGLQNRYPEAFAAAQDPFSHADRLVHGYAGAESELGTRMGKVMEETSAAQTKAQQVAETMYTPHEKRINELTPEHEQSYTKLMQETDHNWDINQQTGKGALYISDKKLSERNVPAEVQDAYRATLKLAYDIQKASNHEILARDPNAEVIPPVYGMLPRRWLDPHKVWFEDDVTGEVAVKGFNSARKAKEFADEVGGRYINDPEFLNQPVQQIIDTVSKRDIMTDGKIDADKLKTQLLVASRSHKSRLGSMTAKRKGRQGYDSLDSSGNLMAAMRRDVTALAKLQHVEPHLRKIDDLAIDADKLNLPVTHALLKSVHDQAAGRVHAGDLASKVKAGFFHTFLSTLNVVAPTMNLLSAGLLTPAHLLTEMQKRLGSQGLAEVLPAFKSTAMGIRSLISHDPKIRKMIEANEAEGATPTIHSVSLGEPTTTNHSKLGNKLRKAAQFNSYLMRKSEHMAKQMTGVAFREAGIAKGLRGHALTLFVHNGVQRTVGEFNAGMRPLFLVGNGSVAMDALAIASTFQSYVIQKVMADLPMIAHVSTPLAMSYLGSIAVAAGAQGIPGVVPTLDYLVEQVDPDGTLTRAWGDFKLEHNIAFHGVLSYTGASGRAELSGPFGVGSQFGANPLGVAGTLEQTLEKWNDGMPFTKAILTIVPGDVRKRVGALGALLNGGEYNPPTASKHEPTYNLSQGSALYTLVTGLNTPDVVQQQEQKGINYDIHNKLVADRKSLFDEAVFALMDDTLTERQKASITRRFVKNQRGKSVAKFWKSVHRAVRNNKQAASPHVRHGFERTLLR